MAKLSSWEKLWCLEFPFYSFFFEDSASPTSHFPVLDCCLMGGGHSDVLWLIRELLSVEFDVGFPVGRIFFVSCVCV